MGTAKFQACNPECKECAITNFNEHYGRVSQLYGSYKAYCCFCNTLAEYRVNDKDICAKHFPVAALPAPTAEELAAKKLNESMNPFKCKIKNCNVCAVHKFKDWQKAELKSGKAAAPECLFCFDKAAYMVDGMKVCFKHLGDAYSISEKNQAAEAMWGLPQGKIVNMEPSNFITTDFAKIEESVVAHNHVASDLKESLKAWASNFPPVNNADLKPGQVYSEGSCTAKPTPKKNPYFVLKPKKPDYLLSTMPKHKAADPGVKYDALEGLGLTKPKQEDSDLGDGTVKLWHMIFNDRGRQYHLAATGTSKAEARVKMRRWASNYGGKSFVEDTDLCDITEVQQYNGVLHVYGEI